MTRWIVTFLALGAGLAPGMFVVKAYAQEPPVTSLPEPKMPPMPSMEGQQGDVSKPVTQIPARKKGVANEKKASSGEKNSPRSPTKPLISHKGR